MTMPGPLGVPLPPAREHGPISLEEAIGARRTVRAFASEALALAEIGQLLWAAQGITGTDGARAAPSAGALYPLELYLMAGAVSGLAAGIYRYDPERHDLTLLEEGDRRHDLAATALDQEWLAAAPVIVVIAARPERTTLRYGRRGHRYVAMEAGHAAENLCLQAVALGLAAGIVGAFGDAEVRELLDLPAAEEPLYLLPAGRAAGARGA